MGIFRALNFALYEDREGERVFNRGRQIEKDTYPQNKMYQRYRYQQEDR